MARTHIERLAPRWAIYAMLVLGAAPAVAASPRTPSPIHVDVTADLTTPAPGDVITYTLRVTNGSDDDYRHLFVFQLLPSGFRVTATTPKADVQRSGPEWRADVAAGTTAVFSVTATAGTVADAEHVATPVRRRSAPLSAESAGAGASGSAVPATASVVTTACARAGSVGPALACGSTKQTLTDAPDDATDSAAWRPGLLGLAFLAVLAVGLQGILRRHGSRREARRDAQWGGRRDSQWNGRRGDGPDGRRDAWRDNRRNAWRDNRRDGERAAAD